MRKFVLFPVFLFIIWNSPIAETYYLEGIDIDPDKIDVYTRDIPRRMQYPPQDEFYIYEEMRTTSDYLSKIAELKEYFNKAMSEEKQSFDELKTGLEKLTQSLNQIGPSSSVETVIDFLKNDCSPYYKSLFDYWLSSNTEIIAPDEVKKAMRRDPLARFFDDEGNFTDINEPNNIVGTIVIALKGDYIDSVKAYIKSAEKLKQDFDDNCTAKITSLDKAEEIIKEYRKMLESRKATAKTKQSFLQTSYLMMLCIGSMSIAFIWLIRFFPNPVVMEWVASGQVIQFITVMILLSVILVLGLASLLSENTLGTLLGGIGGYVLSQGIGRSVARRTQQEQQNPPSME